MEMKWMDNDESSRHFDRGLNRHFTLVTVMTTLWFLIGVGFTGAVIWIIIKFIASKI